MLAIPLLPDGRLDWDAHAEGTVVDVSAVGVGIEFEKINWPDAPHWLIGVVADGGEVRFAGIEVRNRAGRADSGTLRVGGLMGGIGGEILAKIGVTPAAPQVGTELVPHMSEAVIDNWIEHGVLEAALGDRALMCPQCRSLPTFRRGCACCGSGRVRADRMIHHYACAHVGRVSDFETPCGIVCPKCRSKDLIVGADFEYAAGPFVCCDCQWSSSELELVGDCTRCGLRFPEIQAFEQELRGFRVNRLDPLALIAPS
jgi:hypothetical protein